MSQITLKASETKILVEAAVNSGIIVFPARLKDTTRQRIAGLFIKHALAEMVDSELQLSRAGYRAVGLRPPRTAAAQTEGAGEGRVSKRELVRDLLGREQGASLSELIDATGWLPHTTRAALSRLRSDGQLLAKSKRDDGATAYRLLPPEAIALPRLARLQQAETAPAEMAA